MTDLTDDEIRALLDRPADATYRDVAALAQELLDVRQRAERLAAAGAPVAEEIRQFTAELIHDVYDTDDVEVRISASTIARWEGLLVAWRAAQSDQP